MLKWFKDVFYNKDRTAPKSYSCCLKDDKPVPDNRRLCLVNKLIIYTNDEAITLTRKTVKSTCKHFGVVWPWRGFYKWYFKRTSPAYMLKSNNKQTMIRRDSILSFRASISEKYEDISKW